MAIPADLAPIGAEDVAFHDPTGGTTEQTFQRSDWTTGVANATKLSAQRVPLLDDPYLAGAAGFFYELHAGTPTQANLTTELALRLLAKHSIRVYNIERLGMRYGVTDDTNSRRNRDIWDDIIDEIVASGRAGCVYVPFGDWYFRRPASDVGTVVLPTTRSGRTPAGLIILGAGGGASIYANANVPAGDTLLDLTSPASSTIADLTLDKATAGGGVALRLSSDGTNEIFGTAIYRCSIRRGNRNVEIIGNGEIARNTKIIDSALEDASGNSLYASDIAGVTIKNMVTDLDMLLTSPTTGHYLSDILFDNVVGVGVQLLVDTGVTYDSSKHGRVKIQNSAFSTGMSIVDLDQVELDNVLTPAVVYSLSKATSFSKFRAHLKCRGGTGVGLAITVSAGATLARFEIEGGYYEQKAASGIAITASGAAAVIKNGTIHDLTCGENGTTSGSGIRLEGNTGGSVRGIKVHHCELIDEGTPTQLYGYAEVGNVDQCIVDHNFFKGNLTAPYLVVGANDIIDANVEA